VFKVKVVSVVKILIKIISNYQRRGQSNCKVPADVETVGEIN